MDAPIFSVIVNCRNSARFLQSCLESIQNQTFKNYEVIVWDNCSTDNTFEIAFDFSQADVRFKVIHGETSLKLGQARNAAIHKAQGKYLAFLDSDDLWHSNFLSNHHKVLQDSNDNIFGVGNVIEVNSSFNLLNENNYMSSSNTTVPNYIFRKLLKGNTIYFSSLVVPVSFFKDQAWFNPEYVQAEDYELLLRISQKLKCYKTGLAFYRIHEGNVTNKQQKELFIETLEILTPYVGYFWGWLSFKLMAARYFLYLDQPTFGQRLALLKEVKVNKSDLFIGTIILSIVTIKSEFKRAKTK